MNEPSWYWIVLATQVLVVFPLLLVAGMCLWQWALDMFVNAFKLNRDFLRFLIRLDAERRWPQKEDDDA